MSGRVEARIAWRGDEAEDVMRAAAGDALLVGAEYILGESNNVTPLDEGMLINSGAATVNEPELEAAVSYDTPYAQRQHEDLTARHAPGRHAKFLELTLAAKGDRAGKLIGVEMRKRIKAAGNAPEPS